MEKRHLEFRHKHDRDDVGQRLEIAAFLSDRPRTVDEIGAHYQSYIRFMGFFDISSRLDRQESRERFRQSVQGCLDRMYADGWVTHHEDHYIVTDLGSQEAEKMLGDMRQAKEMLKKISRPEIVSKVSLVVHLLLALVKLTAGFLSRSIGLMNDALDTLLDGLSSLLVFFSIKYDREKLVNALLVILMLATGSFALYESIKRFFMPVEPVTGAFSLFATLLSLVACGLLGVYQRVIGLRAGNMALITQSVDSRNHVIVAGGVLVGLVFSSFGIYLADTLVGLAVAALILKSGVELLIDLFRMLRGETLDLSRFQMGISKRYHEFRRSQLSDWMIYMVGRQGIDTLERLAEAARESMDFGDNPALRELGLSKVNASSDMVSEAVAYLTDQKLVLVESGQVQLTATGQKRLIENLRQPNRLRFEERSR